MSMLEDLSSDDDGFACMRSFDGEASIHFIRDEKRVGISFRSVRGLIEIGVGGDCSPFVVFRRDKDHHPIALSIDELSGQPIVHFKTTAGKLQTVPLDKVLEALVARSHF
jgi:hypothetical protein